MSSFGRRIGTAELVVIFVIALLIFSPSRLSELGKISVNDGQVITIKVTTPDRTTISTSTYTFKITYLL